MCACFARAEFALKATRYAVNRRGAVASHWDNFARDMAAVVDSSETPELMEAVNYLHAHPPKRQVVNGQRAAFEAEATQSTRPTVIERALEYTRRIRNNLFHGVKYFDSDESNRDPRLIDAALIVLEACVRADPAVWIAYEYGDA